VQRLFRLADKENFAAEFVDYAESLVPTSGVSIDFGLSEPVTEMEGNIICLDPVVLGSFPSNYDASLAPPGRQLSTWLMIIPHDRANQGSGLKDAIKDLREFIVGLYPGFFERVEWERPLAYTILDGVDLKVGQTRLDRHDVKSPDVKRLFFVGDTAKGDGCSGDIAFDSAMKAAPIIQNLLKGA
jgi:phytoene dehydrogenase-like protein